MKVAVCHFGLPRGAPPTMESVAEKIVSPLEARCDADELNIRTFFHLFRPESIDNPRSQERGKIDESAYLCFGKHEGEIEPPLDSTQLPHFDLAQRFADPYCDSHKSVSNLLHQLYSLSKVFERAREWNPEVYIFARPDLLYHENIAFSHVKYAATSESACFIPPWAWWDGCNDRFAICGRISAEVYARRIDLVDTYLTGRRRGLHAERFLGASLQSPKVLLLTTPLRASRVRIDGNVKQEVFDCFSTAGNLFSRFRLARAMIRTNYYCS